uniref:Uncharacterized protein n=1 Tax=Monopterus albus TaxID=43700 RepID=A0A3Q3JEA0_MONAL
DYFLYYLIVFHSQALIDGAVLNACFAKLLTFHFLSWCLVSSYPALPGSPKCPPGQFPCLDSVGCVDVSARCDGQSQCPTGSDEENCTATKGCLDSDWSCRNYICIPKELRCSGLNDCMDNSDEEGCGEKGVNAGRIDVSHSQRVTNAC